MTWDLILALVGTSEQKHRYLHPLLAGDLRSAFSMTEPDTAGSDPTLLQTTATRDGREGGWIINGHKWFSSNGSIADFLIVMAVTDPDSRPHQRASMFIVDADSPGVRILRDVRPSVGGHVSPRPCGPDLRRSRRGPPRLGRPTGVARIPSTTRRCAHRAHPDSARGGEGAVRGAARGRYGQRLSSRPPAYTV
jgi:Acyl-CoA dehydrogenase, middle domain